MKQEQKAQHIDVAQLGRRIASRRRLLDMTQAELAKDAGLTQTTVARVERGAKKKVELDTICRIAQILNTDVTALMRPIEEFEPV